MSDPIVLTGINGTTGDYLPGPVNLDTLYAAATERTTLDEVRSAPHYADLRERDDRSSRQVYSLAAGIDPKKLNETGWGVIVASSAKPELIQAISPLLQHRKSQIQTHPTTESFFQIFERHRGYQPNDTKQKFLARLNVGVGIPADPTTGVPYYLLLVGSPAEIPWAFQYDLDVEYAVGRIHFETSTGEPDFAAYRRYAESVVLAETRPAALPKSVQFFAPQHDAATQFSAGKLVEPVEAKLQMWTTQRQNGWTYQKDIGTAAKKDRLSQLLGCGSTPGVLFTASHGVGFHQGDARQKPDQGALVCQDVGAAVGTGPLPESAYFAGRHLDPAARLHGLISFHFACYGAGTPTRNGFPGPDLVFRNQTLAPTPFVAQLPQALLSHPNGGALAFVGHVDRAWSCSFLLTRESEQVGVFTSFLKQLLDGVPIGHALEYFNDRYAALATLLTTRYDELRANRIEDDDFKMQVAKIWLEHNDARNYTLFGDPAVHVNPATGTPIGPADLSAELGRTPATTRPAIDIVPAPAPVPAPVSPPSPSEPTSQAVPFDLAQVQATETRFDQQYRDAETFAYDSVGTRDLFQRNDPKRLTDRLRRLGLSPDRAQNASRRLHEGPFDFATSIDGWPEPVLERLLGTHDLLNANFLARGLAAARAVGRITIGGDPPGHGTGFLVSPRLVLTNHHVLPEATVAAKSWIDFDYEDGLDGQPRVLLSAKFDPEAFFLHHAELDFTLVALNDSDARSLTDRQALTLGPTADRYVIGEHVTIIQHPNGERKQIALRDNQVIGEVAERFLHYRTDTMPGSSGSPVFNDAFELVALHHSGVPARDPKTGAILARDGTPWRRSMGLDRVKWRANEGVLGSAILAHLAERTLTSAEREFQAELFAGSPPRPGTETGFVAGTAVGLPIVEGSTLTIPLELRVQIEWGPVGPRLMRPVLTSPLASVVGLQGSEQSRS